MNPYILRRAEFEMKVRDRVVTWGLAVSIIAGGVVGFAHDKYILNYKSFSSNVYETEPYYQPTYTHLYPYTDASTITLTTGVQSDVKFAQSDKVASYNYQYKPVNKFQNIPPRYGKPPSYAIPMGVQLFKIDRANPERLEYFYKHSDGLNTEFRPVRIHNRLKRA